MANAMTVGVSRILAVGTDLETSAECVRLAARFSSVFAAVGIHPHDADGFELTSLVELRHLGSQPKVVAIGEIGLDYVRSTSSPAAQRIAFGHQMALAAELGLPIVVHNRGADDDVMSLIADVKKPNALAGRAGVLHCFGGGLEFARQAQEVDFSISFAGNLTYRRSTELRAVASRVPLSWLLIETDCPYLSPEPKRGRVNEPDNVELVARELATIRNDSAESVALETSENAAALFAWK
ncbi:MAG TPA: TatD family hydrolase [Chloroflexota bacterium]|nr:TatD family hydrolase [Chloroflexota bacterium]